MGWFSNPNCPQCGRETVETGYSFPYPQLRCNYCVKVSKTERKSKETIADLEARLSKLEESK